MRAEVDAAGDKRVVNSGPAPQLRPFDLDVIDAVLRGMLRDQLVLPHDDQRQVGKAELLGEHNLLGGSALGRAEAHGDGTDHAKRGNPPFTIAPRFRLHVAPPVLRPGMSGPITRSYTSGPG